MKRQNPFNRALAVLLCFCVSFLIFYSTVYVSTHIEHQCTGQGCMTCHHLMAAEKLVEGVSHLSGITAFAVFCSIFYLQCISLYFCLLSGRTLISDKVRLDA